MGLAPRLGEALGVERRETGFDVGGRRLRGRMVVDEFAETSWARPDEEVVRCMAGFDGGSGIMTRWRLRTTSAQLSGDGGLVSVEEASDRAYRLCEMNYGLRDGALPRERQESVDFAGP
jgi:hypothetical protein